jgi:hypothetical protein
LSYVHAHTINASEVGVDAQCLKDGTDEHSHGIEQPVPHLFVNVVNKLKNFTQQQWTCKCEQVIANFEKRCQAERRAECFPSSLDQ